MNESDDLYALIQRLSKAEKKYFLQYASLYEGKNAPLYLKLFQALTKHPIPSDEELKKIMSVKKGSNALSTTRHYLYKLILRVLHAFHAGYSEEADLFDLLSEANLLMKKGLDKQAIKVLNKAQKKAEEQGDIYVLDIIHIVKYNINRSTVEFLQDYTVAHQEIEKAYERNEQRAEILKYLKLRSEIGVIYAKAGHDLRSKEVNDRVLEIHHEVLKPPTKHASLLSRVYQMEAVEFSSFLLRYSRERIAYLEASIAFSEEHERISYAPYNRLICSYQNLGTAYFHNDENDKFLKIRDKLDKLKVKDFRSEIKLFDAKAHLDLGFLLQNLQFDRADLVLPEIENGLSKYAPYITDRKSLGILYYLVGLIYFYTSKYKYSLLWFNKIINMPSGEARVDMYKFSRLFSIFIHYELDNLDGTDYTIASLKRMYQKEKESRFEKEVIACFQSLSKAYSKEEKAKELESFKQVLLKLKEDPLEEQMFLYFNFTNWVESKQRGIPLIELMKEKTEKP